MARVLQLSDLEAYGESLKQQRAKYKKTLSVCTGTGCKAYRCDDLAASLRQEVTAAGLGGEVEVVASGCHGFCERGALLVIHPEDVFYQRCKPEDAKEIVEKTIVKGELLQEHLYAHPTTGEKIARESEIPFYRDQMQVLMGPGRFLDPTKIEDYLGAGGYTALVKVLREMQPDQVVDLITRSGLRGRGGGGFPAGVKWKEVREAKGSPKYVICNADEGDPGAYMDRSLIEGNPHCVIEGMLIAAYAIGSTEGYIYVRHEYPYAVKHVGIALEQARAHGLLGDNVLGTGMKFDIKVSRGGGAFVCGESTALMSSLEGLVGEPRDKYIHTAKQGLYLKPTNLNNVETYANVPVIVNRGLEWYTSIGTGDVSTNPWGGSKGTKIFSLVGKVNHTGLVEVPMGTPLRQIVFDLGGGVPEGRAFKAVQTGGPSGGCIPAELLDLPVDFDELDKAGSMMGSGGLIVMDDRTCMVDVARYFQSFLVEESCGKCVPCREGNRRIRDILDRICQGLGTRDDIPTLERLAKAMMVGSLCALGKTAVNPVLSTLRYFRSEYEAHIEQHRCPAAVCRKLIRYTINDQCNGCSLCARVCPQKAITGEKKKAYLIDQDKCDRCGVCQGSCKFAAIDVA